MLWLTFACSSAPCRLGPQGTLRGDPEQELEGTALLTTVRGSDPEYIKRLKREMHVALRCAPHALPAPLEAPIAGGMCAVCWITGRSMFPGKDP
jgi:hypothetical protein